MDPNGAVAQVADEAIASQELMITRIENTMAGMEESNLQSDPRYQQMDYLKQKLQGKYIYLV
jgi:predicted DNA-binding ribbon-helix-helix protein